MHLPKTILILIAFSLVTAAPVFSKQGNSAAVNRVSGKVKILDDGTSVWIEFKADKAKSNQAVSGFFHRWLDDESKETYADVVYMKVDGEYAWLAGKCTSDSGDLAGRWFFMAVHDGGTPGRLVDHIWLDWLPDTSDAESVAKGKVENLEKPANNKSIETGDIVVESCNKEN